MAATGFTPIQLYRTTTAAAAPVSGNLSAGEIAINVNDADMALYAKNNTGNVKRLMNNPAGLKYPTADGTAGQFVGTNAAGVLSFSSTLVAPILGTPTSGTLTNCTFPTLNQNTTGTAANVTGVVTVPHGGTGLTSLTTGYIPYGNGAGALSSSVGLRFDTALRGSYGAGAITSNFAAGDATLSVNTTGYENTANGVTSLFSNTTGYDNTASGVQALYSNTTGTFNTASGANALFNNTTGTLNTASGVQALQSNTTGYENTAHGVTSLFSNTTGNNNLAIGSRALTNNTTGSNNSAVGYNTGLGITTGSGNTIIGANVTGLSASLANNVILANGTGSIRVQSNATTITFADVIKPPQATTAAAPAYVKGGMYFDTTLNKMRIGGATAWETVTST